MHEAFGFLSKRTAELTRFAQALIRTESVHGNETAVAKVIQKQLNRYGIRSSLLGKDPQRRSLLADVGRRGPILMLNGHLDTVPLGNLRLWKHAPLSGKIVAGKIYGRGSYDMKCSVAAATYAAIAFAHVTSPARGRIRLLFNFDEESGHHSGVKDALRRGITADSAICAEPMYDRTLNIGARGIFRCELIAHGRSGHTGYKGSGVNAVAIMAKLLLALENLKLSSKPTPLMPPPHLTPGTLISGGTGVNIYPHECRATIDCRLCVGMTQEGVLRELNHCLKNEQKRDRFLRFSIRPLSFLPAAVTAKHEPIVRAAKAAIRKTHGYPPRLGTMFGGTDGNFLINAGIPTVIFGVEGSGAHEENEYASVASLIRSTQAFLLTAEKYFTEQSERTH